eukprot:TRINITY_DN530_c0_g1_i4.p2 TRINITY_DN530_c0_g1~~TRINITY_DN530_c0_g1_i4.p2  ORF type:complete len:198 (-),score=-11.64 TRINITY_DN530_c0_g1_i4:754-1347(-)
MCVSIVIIIQEFYWLYLVELNFVRKFNAFFKIKIGDNCMREIFFKTGIFASLQFCQLQLNQMHLEVIVIIMHKTYKFNYKFYPFLMQIQFFNSQSQPIYKQSQFLRVKFVHIISYNILELQFLSESNINCSQGFDNIVLSQFQVLNVKQQKQIFQRYSQKYISNQKNLIQYVDYYSQNMFLFSKTASFFIGLYYQYQ